MMTTVNTRKMNFQCSFDSSYSFKRKCLISEQILSSKTIFGRNPTTSWSLRAPHCHFLRCCVFADLTYDGVGLRSKGTHTGGAWGHLELGEAPLGAEVLGKEAGRGQTAGRAARQIGAQGWRSPSLRVNIYPELPVRQQETQLTSYTQKAINRDQGESKNVTFRSSHWQQIEIKSAKTGEINALVFNNESAF